MSILYYLSQTKVLWTTFLLTLALTLCFGVIMNLYQFGIIDEMFVASDIRAHIESMSLQQRRVHAWMTGTLDVLYPFAYGAFFVGVAFRYFARYRLWLIIPGILVIPFDLTEGFAQVMLLVGNADYMALKIGATQGKLLLYITGLVITAVGLLKALGGRPRRG